MIFKIWAPHLHRGYKKILDSWTQSQLGQKSPANCHDFHCFSSNYSYYYCHDYWLVAKSCRSQSFPLPFALLRHFYSLGQKPLQSWCFVPASKVRAHMEEAHIFHLIPYLGSLLDQQNSCFYIFCQHLSLEGDYFALLHCYSPFVNLQQMYSSYLRGIMCFFAACYC